MEELTKAQQLVEIAKWVKIQNPEFTKHFKSMRSIIKFYLQLPKEYDRKKSVVAFINKGLKSNNYLVREQAKRLSLIINSLFGIRFFKDAPHKWTYYLSLRRWTNAKRTEEYIEVRCTPIDQCYLGDNFKRLEFGTRTISIKSLGDAKRAADKMLADLVEHNGDDYEVTYGMKLAEAMKQSNPTDNELEEGIEVII